MCTALMCFVLLVLSVVTSVHGGGARGTIWMNSTTGALLQVYVNQYGAILEPALCNDIKGILSNDTLSTATVVVTSWNATGKGNADIAVSITIENAGVNTVALSGMLSSWNSALAAASTVTLPLNQTGILLKRLICTSNSTVIFGCNQSSAAFLKLVRADAVAVIDDTVISDGCLGISCFGLAMVCVLVVLVIAVGGGTYYCCVVYRGKKERCEDIPTATSTDRDGLHPYTTSNRFKSNAISDDEEEDPFAVDVAPVNEDPFTADPAAQYILRGSIADRRGVPGVHLPTPSRESSYVGSTNTTPTSKTPKSGWPTAKGDRTPTLPPAASRRPSFVSLPPDMAEERKKLESQSWIWQHLE